MKLVVFSKMLKERSTAELIDWAQEVGLDGYDLCVRPGYAVNPDNVLEALPAAVTAFRRAGLDIPMVTGNFDLLWPTDPGAETVLQAMDKADVRLLKLGYFKFNPLEQDYWAEVDRIRRGFAGWERLAWRYGVKICYHTHSNRCMGLNAGMLCHLVRGFEPTCIGAYLDAGHLVAEGEEFAVAAAMLQPYLSIVAVKDFLLTRGEKNGHGVTRRSVVPAGTGMVDWTAVFETLARVGFDGPVSAHCEFKVPEGSEFGQVATKEVAFFRRFVPAGT
ncbi:MAG: sugar phosphate isomerase/epimerase [Kiritimatiellaeota bacterium]|nr:sugar phosphate isomerase/epimerase [Kiritimatiellota bacterium]